MVLLSEYPHWSMLFLKHAYRSKLIRVLIAVSKGINNSCSTNVKYLVNTHCIASAYPPFWPKLLHSFIVVRSKRPPSLFKLCVLRCIVRDFVPVHMMMHAYSECMRLWAITTHQMLSASSKHTLPLPFPFVGQSRASAYGRLLGTLRYLVHVFAILHDCTDYLRNARLGCT